MIFSSATCINCTLFFCLMLLPTLWFISCPSRAVQPPSTCLKASSAASVTWHIRFCLMDHYTVGLKLLYPFNMTPYFGACVLSPLTTWKKYCCTMRFLLYPFPASFPVRYFSGVLVDVSVYISVGIYPWISVLIYVFM